LRHNKGSYLAKIGGSREFAMQSVLLHVLPDTEICTEFQLANPECMQRLWLVY
jgi:putative hemolysin